MKLLSIILNLTLLAYISYKVMEQGLPNFGEEDFWVLLLIITLPCVNLICILDLGNKGKRENKDSLISLYFKRKKLEEEIKIKKISEQ